MSDPVRDLANGITDGVDDSELLGRTATALEAIAAELRARRVRELKDRLRRIQAAKARKLDAIEREKGITSDQ
jgi:hypothetical protein